MKNWKDYVGFQPITPLRIGDEVGAHYVFVMKVLKHENNSLSMSIIKELLPAEEYKYTKDEIGTVVESILSEFPTWDELEKVDVKDKKQWFFGFGSYNKIVDGARVLVKNYIELKLPWYQKDEVDNEKLQYIKQLKKDSKKLSDVEFESKHNIPKNEAKWLTNINTTFGFIPFRIPLPYIHGESKQDQLDVYNYCRIGNKIAAQTRRGVGRTKAKIENLVSVFYKGDSPYDVPLIVSEYKGKYAVYKHPDFEKYGFTVNKED